MDDTCAVCAETLEWIAYGRCGHKDVCSTCVARLRFICNDRRCCICKSESSIIFVTKALGDYTKTISDFSVFPSENKEGRFGTYMYHEDTQSYFDDLDHYNMIRAMCRLSCSVCDKTEDNSGNKSKRKAKFRDINQLKGHLFHQHKLIMCSLCLEGRKVFICEQKLYSKAQLEQHVHTGDSEVDGTESERGGFQGHPLCEFCRTPFYGDNELYTHMNTEHFKCHICQRRNPGKYEYFKSYDELEIHFRQEHFLCEDEACLTKKFIVFPSEAEMKVHNAQEHGGRLSRSKRNAVLQLPTSFTYRRNTEHDNRRGRRNTFLRDLPESELSRAIEASLETSNSRFLEASSSSGPVLSNNNINNIIPLVQPFESLAADSDPPSRYFTAVSHRTRNTPLEESAFPPLPAGPAASARKPSGLLRNTMAENLRRQNKKKVNVLNTGNAWPAAPRMNHNNINNNNKPSSSSVSRPVNTSNAAALPTSGQRKSTVNLVGAPSRISHSTSAPNLVNVGSVSDFPPVSTLQTRNGPGNGPSTKSVDEVHAANKSMVDKLRAGLDNDQEKFASFKEVSGQYRQGVIDAETYLVYVDQFGLSHLVLDLARLLPDPNKEKELISVYNANRVMGGLKGNDWKNKGKSVANNKTITNVLTDNILTSVRELQLNYRPPDDEGETLSKDGYRAVNKGKSKVEVDDRTSPGGQLVIKSPTSEGCNGGQRKKTSKFLRVRLGNGSQASLDLNNSNGGSDAPLTKGESAGKAEQETTDGIPVRGVWRNGGGHRLIVKDLKGPRVIHR
ncbi:putative transcription factor interactor and regulator C2H2 family [Helianthus anomalus]